MTGRAGIVSTVGVFWCLRSVVMVLVSFAGALGYAVLNKSLSDKWYLWFSPQHPPWTGHGVVRVPTASSWCKDMCTVTFGLTTGFESFCKDQTECLTKPADGEYLGNISSAICLGETQSVGFTAASGRSPQHSRSRTDAVTMGTRNLANGAEPITVVTLCH